MQPQMDRSYSTHSIDLPNLSRGSRQRETPFSSTQCMHALSGDRGVLCPGSSESGLYIEKFLALRGRNSLMTKSLSRSHATSAKCRAPYS